MSEYDYKDEDVDTQFTGDAGDIARKIKWGQAQQAPHQMQGENRARTQGEESDKLSQILKIQEEMTPEEKIMSSFLQSASTYWGDIQGASIVKSRATKNTQYYLIVASSYKNGNKIKLITEWFVNKDGIAKSGKTVTIPDDLADDIGLLIME